MKAQVSNKVSVPQLVSFVPLEHILNSDEVKETYRPLDKGWVEELAMSISRDGLDTPITVWDGGPDVQAVKIDGKEVTPSFLIAGNHRRAALKKIRKEQPDAFKAKFPNGIPVIRRSGSLKEALCAQLRENAARKDPSAEDLLPLMIRLRDEFKMNGKTIAASIGRSTSYVSEVFNVEKELGEEGKEAVLKGELSAKHAIKAAKDVKEARKSGKTVDVKAVVAGAKAKTASAKASGRERDEKRMSAKKIWKNYKALPGRTVGQKLVLCEAGLAYLSGETDKLPSELKKSDDKASKTEKE
jgi:ParB-like chromosome segregation protein Spo0J